MNDDELDAVIDDHYAGETQTLTSGAEANLLADRVGGVEAALRSGLSGGFTRGAPVDS